MTRMGRRWPAARSSAYLAALRLLLRNIRLVALNLLLSAGNLLRRLLPPRFPCFRPRLKRGIRFLTFQSIDRRLDRSLLGFERRREVLLARLKRGHLALERCPCRLEIGRAHV